MKRVDTEAGRESAEIVYDMQRAKQAVHFLVESSYFHHHIKNFLGHVSNESSWLYVHAGFIRLQCVVAPGRHSTAGAGVVRSLV